jgi:hypothetical protein
MATFRNRSGKWQARVQTKGYSALSKTFINIVDAERWAKQVEVEMQKASYTNLMLAEQNEKSVVFRNLNDIGNHVGLFYKQSKIRGRPPLGCAQLDLTDPEQLALTILKTLPKQ